MCILIFSPIVKCVAIECDMLCVDRYSNIAWVGLANGVVTGYNLLDNVATHYLYSTGVNLVGNYANCGCMLSSVNHVSSIEPGLLCASPYNIDFLSRTGGTPIAVLAKDTFANMPEDSHIVTSLLGGDSIHLSVYNYLLSIDPNNGKQTSCATLSSPIVSLAGYNGESSNTSCGIYLNKTIRDINNPCSLYSKSSSNTFPYNPLVTVGTISGDIELFDFRENESVARIRSHKSRILDLSCNNFYIASVGLSVQGIYEPIVRLHDLRMLKSHINWLGVPVNMVQFINDNQYIAAGMDHYHICNISGKTTSRKVHYLRPGEHMQTTILSFAHRRNSIVILHDDYNISSEKLPEFPKDEDANSFKLSKLDGNFFNSPKNGTIYPQLLSVSNDDHSNVIAQFLFFCPGVVSICTHVCLIENCLACMLASALKILVTQQNDKDRIESVTPIHNKRLMNSCHKISSLVPKSCSIKTVRDDVVHLLDNIHKDLNVVSECKLIHDIFGVHIDIDYKCPNDHLTSVTKVYNSLRITPNEEDHTFLNCMNEMLYNTCVAKASCKVCNHVLSLEKTAKFSNLILVECLGESSIWSADFIPNEFYIKSTKDESKGCLSAFDVPPEDNSSEMASKYTLISVLAYYNNASTISFGNDAMARIFGFKSKLIVYTKTETGWIVISGSHMDVVKEGEPTDFSHPFKLPVALVYKKEILDPVQVINPAQNNSETSVLDGNRLVPIPPPTLKCPVPCTIFLNDTNLAHNMESHKQALTFTPLTLAELAKINSGDFILALDIECVSGDVERRRFFRPFLNNTNFESNIELIPPKPPHVPILARVSMIRASGNMAGVPFIDHYIYHKLPPRDYLTKYSGLFCGDLDLRESKHWLTTKKSIYLKTRYLVDSGCKFIGHGIINDFQILNIAVPTSQIIDTVELYYMPGERYISLQFLAAHVLRKKIQLHVHDSVQDATTSMELYKLYLGANEKGMFNNIVKRLYQIGHNTNWKVPN